MKIFANMIAALRVILEEHDDILDPSLDRFQFLNYKDSPCICTTNGHAILLIMQKDGKTFKENFSIDADTWIYPYDVIMDDTDDTSDIKKTEPLESIPQIISNFTHNSSEGNYLLPPEKYAHIAKVAKCLNKQPIIKRYENANYCYFDLGNNYYALMIITLYRTTGYGTPEDGFPYEEELEESFELLKPYTNAKEHKEQAEHNYSAYTHREIDINHGNLYFDDCYKIADDNVILNIGQEKIKRPGKRSINDCTKSNSIWICGVVTDDIDKIVELSQDKLGMKISIDPISKTQFRIFSTEKDLSSYPIIRTGNRYQLRELKNSDNLPDNPCDINNHKEEIDKKRALCTENTDKPQKQDNSIYEAAKDVTSDIPDPVKTDIKCQDAINMEAKRIVKDKPRLIPYSSCDYTYCEHITEYVNIPLLCDRYISMACVHNMLKACYGESYIRPVKTIKNMRPTKARTYKIPDPENIKYGRHARSALLPAAYPRRYIKDREWDLYKPFAMQPISLKRMIRLIPDDASKKAKAATIGHILPAQKAMALPRPPPFRWQLDGSLKYATQ